MAILSSIVLSQQCSEVYIISSYSSEAVIKLSTTEISHPDSRIKKVGGHCRAKKKKGGPI